MVTPTLVLPEDQRLIFAILSLFGLFGGIILYFIAKNDPAEKFYAKQQLLFGLTLMVSLVTCIGPFLMVAYSIYIAYTIYTTGGYFVPYLHKWAGSGQ